jgi:hypothetical protein
MHLSSSSSRGTAAATNSTSGRRLQTTQQTGCSTVMQPDNYTKVRDQTLCMLQTGWSRYARLARAAVQHSLRKCTEHVYATLIYTPHALATLIRSPAAKYGAALKIMQHSQLCKHTRYCATHQSQHERARSGPSLCCCTPCTGMTAPVSSELHMMQVCQILWFAAEVCFKESDKLCRQRQRCCDKCARKKSVWHLHCMQTT